MSVPQQGNAQDYQSLRARSVVTHNVYETYTKKVVDASQPGGYVEVSGFGKLLSSEELYDFTSWKVHLTMGVNADTYHLVFPNYGGKYTSTFRSGEEISISVGYPPTNGPYTAQDLTQIIIGRIDDVDYEFSKDGGEMVHITGRNYAAPFLDNRVSKKYTNMTASQIVTDLVDLYGFGISASINILADRKFNKTVVTRNSQSATILQKHDPTTVLQLPPSILNPTKNRGVAGTTSIIDNVIGHNDTAWKVLKDLALALADPKTGKEYKVYVEGKTIYFGPRQDELNPSVTITYGQNMTELKLRETTQFLKTRVIMRQYVEKKSKSYDIIIPDDVGPDMLSDIDKQKYLNLRKRYGTRDLLVKDLRKFIQGNTHLAKLTGLARLRESARLTYTGSVIMAGIETLGKEGTLKILGVPDENGDPSRDFSYNISKELNALYYLESAEHNYDKENGYTTEAGISTRRPDQTRKLTASSTAVAAQSSTDLEATE